MTPRRDQFVTVLAEAGEREGTRLRRYRRRWVIQHVTVLLAALAVLGVSVSVLFSDSGLWSWSGLGALLLGGWLGLIALVGLRG